MNIEDFILGFHGTHNEASEKILCDREFSFTQRNNHWLGNGVYFFRDDDYQAMSWAIDRTRKTKKEKAVVIRAEIQITNEGYLNLDLKGHLKRFGEIVEKDVQDEMPAGIEPQKEDPDGSNKMRCAIMDLLPPKIKVIERTFSSGEYKPEWLESMGLDTVGKQVCVRDDSVIKKSSITEYKTKKVNTYKRKRKSNNLKFKK